MPFFPAILKLAILLRRDNIRSPQQRRQPSSRQEIINSRDRIECIHEVSLNVRKLFRVNLMVKQGLKPLTTNEANPKPEQQ